MRFSGLFLFLLLAACASETSYRAPEAGQPAARVRFAATSAEHVLLVTAYGGAQCEKDASSGAMGIVEGRAIERAVRADRPFVFAVQRLAHGRTAITCSVSMSMEPRPNAQYEVEYGEDPSSCYLNVYRLEGAKPARVREPSAALTPKECRD